MRVLINDKPADALTPKQDASFMLSKLQQDVKATVLLYQIWKERLAGVK